MLTINITTEDTKAIQTTNPQYVEAYIGAMDSYERYCIAGITWRLPTIMVEEIVTAFREKYPNGLPKENIYNT